MPYCTHCGHNNPEGSNFCARCGRPLSSDVDTTATDPTGEERRADAGSDAGQGSDAGAAESKPSEGKVSGDTTKVIPAVVDDPAATELSAEDEQAVEDLPKGSALLIVRRGNSAGARFLLDKDESTAGRHPGSDIFLDDVTVSRHHVKFTRTAEGMVTRDVGSLNGTYVNRTLIDGEVLLRSGDEVQIGRFRMVYLASTHGLG